MAKKAPTAAERRIMSRIADLGCMACAADGIENDQVELHHVRFLGCMGKRAPHTACLPLCPDHHRTGGHGVALHAGQWTFEAVYGSEESMLRKVYESINQDYPFDR